MCPGLLFPAAPRYKSIASLFLDHGVSPNLPDRRGLPLILHSGTATTRQLLLDAGACVPAWFDAEDSAAACQDDENCGEVPGMSGLGEAVFDPKEEHCDARLGTLVNGVRDFAFFPLRKSFKFQTANRMAEVAAVGWWLQAPRHISGQTLAELCPCRCGRWTTPPTCEQAGRHGSTRVRTSPQPFFVLRNLSECPLGILTTLGP